MADNQCVASALMYINANGPGDAGPGPSPGPGPGPGPGWCRIEIVTKMLKNIAKHFLIMYNDSQI